MLIIDGGLPAFKENIEKVRHELNAGGGKILVRGALSEYDRDRLATGITNALVAGIPDDVHFDELRSYNGGVGNGLVKCAGVGQIKDAWEARKIVREYYQLIYDVKDVVSNAGDALCILWEPKRSSKKRKLAPSNLAPHYDYCTIPGSLPQQLHDALKERSAPVTECVQCILTLQAKGHVGTRLCTRTLDEDEHARNERCSTGSKADCFRKIEKDTDDREYTDPLGEAGDIVFWNSKVAHFNASEGSRLAVPACFCPAYAVPLHVKKQKMEIISKGAVSNHWPNAAKQDGTMRTYYNTDKPNDNRNTKFFCVPEQQRVTPQEVEHLL